MPPQPTAPRTQQGNGYSLNYFAVAAGTSILVLAAAAAFNLWVRPVFHKYARAYATSSAAAQRERSRGCAISLRPTPLLHASDEHRPEVCLLGQDNDDQGSVDVDVDVGGVGGGGGGAGEGAELGNGLGSEEREDALDRSTECMRASGSEDTCSIGSVEDQGRRKCGGDAARAVSDVRAVSDNTSSTTVGDNVLCSPWLSSPDSLFGDHRDLAHDHVPPRSPGL